MWWTAATESSKYYVNNHLVGVFPTTGTLISWSLPICPALSSTPRAPFSPLEHSLKASSLRLFSLYRPYDFCSLLATYRCRSVACMRSSILSFRVRRSSVLWPWLRWYQQYLRWSALKGEGNLRGFLIRSALRASSRIHVRPVLRGVYLKNLGLLGSSLDFWGF